MYYSLDVYRVYVKFDDNSISSFCRSSVSPSMAIKHVKDDLMSEGQHNFKIVDVEVVNK